jgi:hypothetical protein
MESKRAAAMIQIEHNNRPPLWLIVKQYTMAGGCSCKWLKKADVAQVATHRSSAGRAFCAIFHISLLHAS